jgi:Rpp20 subunit of nuclear RNase MRP and P
MDITVSLQTWQTLTIKILKMFSKRIAQKQLEENKFFVSKKTIPSKLISKALKTRKFKLSGMGRQTKKVVEIGLKINRMIECKMDVTTSTCQVYDDIAGMDTIGTSIRLQSCIEIQVEVVGKSLLG